MRSSRLLSDLAKAFEFLPGIGPKSAQRLAFHMMDGNKDKSLFLSEIIAKCVEGIQRCRFCRNYCESDIVGFVLTKIESLILSALWRIL